MLYSTSQIMTSFYLLTYAVGHLKRITVILGPLINLTRYSLWEPYNRREAIITETACTRPLQCQNCAGHVWLHPTCRPI